MAESPLGVSEPHAAIILDFLRFARFRRGQCVKSVQTAFQELMDSRLVEDTFTSEEVKDMLTGLCAVVGGDMESELIHSSHTHSLLLSQLLQQAEHWHLTLQADIAALENMELLEAIAQYEQQISSPASAAVHKDTLKPLSQSGGEKLLQLEISRLEEEKQRLQQRLQSVETKAAAALGERDELKTQLAASETTPTVSTPTPQHNDVIALQQRIVKLQQQLTEGAPATSDLQRELAEKSKELLRVAAELDRVRGDLDRKFSDTAQYMNMRKMLSSKNDQIKELRTQLRKYES